MNRQRLRVVYNGPEDGPHIDAALDKAIEETVAKFGFVWWASGCDMVPPFERDLAFEKSEEQEVQDAREALQE